MSGLAKVGLRMRQANWWMIKGDSPVLKTKSQSIMVYGPYNAPRECRNEASVVGRADMIRDSDCALRRFQRRFHLPVQFDGIIQPTEDVRNLVLFGKERNWRRNLTSEVHRTYR